ncbi:hypothetical protein ATY41_08555 [Leifsonia xyli subsp. xyli]|uniref:Pyridoxamine 5'-phosphate oxidase N-terminal domain-containing protein n=2 Tax=Leifsonia xyli subsp. xyli TaxID=59736 RepID=Q6AG35_LEIXX|nr:pyridoxamine 5'-phosphate oxidase family protein [Leifsonia xyli]AAT88660.1 conserved hypothetical protein [Leifsonia xyli subsp. xyli str. CTCB07]ODA90816.1 hypothetical protein ATY41_08555 [Leifsonia xyli subsp. xyli]
MTSTTAVEHADERERYRTFLAERATLTLGVADRDGVPMVAVTPFAAVDDALYLYVSALADHHDALAAADEVAVLFRADEAGAPNLFALERARFRCAVRVVHDEGDEAVFDRFVEVTSPALVRLLRALDFRLYRLEPLAGRYVVGFGKAYDVDWAGDRFDHVVIDKTQS